MTLSIGWMQRQEKLLLDTLNLECSRLMTLLKLFQQLDLPQTCLWCVFLLFHSIYVQKHILWFCWSLNLIFGRNLIYLFLIYLIFRPIWILLFFFFLGIVIIFKHWRAIIQFQIRQYFKSNMLFHKNVNFNFVIQ